MPHLTLKQNEAKLITLTVSVDGSALDVSDAELSFTMKKDISSTTAELSVANEDFIDTDAVNGIVSFFLTESDAANLTPGQYYGELTVTISGENETILKTQNLSIVVDRSLN